MPGWADITIGILVVGEAHDTVRCRHIDFGVQRRDELASLRGGIDQVVAARIGPVTYDVVELGSRVVIYLDAEERPIKIVYLYGTWEKEW